MTAGTLLHGTRLPLRVWLRAIELEVRPDGVSTAELARQTMLSYDTAWHVKQRLQAAMKSGSAAFLHAFVDAAWGLIHGARRPRDPRCENLPYVVFCTLGDHVYACPLRQSSEVRQALTRLRPKSRASLDRVVVDTMRDVWRRIERVHHGVSQLWFPAYLDAIATARRWRASGSSLVETGLRAILNTPRTTFDSLRPERPPHWLRATREATA